MFVIFSYMGKYGKLCQRESILEADPLFPDAQTWAGVFPFGYDPGPVVFLD